MNDYPALSLCIDGKWIEKASAGSRPVINPASGLELGQLPLAGEEELALAAEAAARGFERWRRTPPQARRDILLQTARLLRERIYPIARIITREQGKPLAESQREIMAAAETLDFFAEEGARIGGRLVPPRGEAVLMQAVTRVPVGPAALFTPWNFPLNLPARKLGAALAAGCSAVIKPSEEAPGSAIALARAFHDAGLPPGVLNLVCGEPQQVADRLIGHPAIRKVSFTGSIAVGKRLGEQCARGVKRFTAEMGGHAPVLVMADADAGKAARLALAAKFRNAGQVCAAPTRFFVHRSLFKPFVEAFVAGAFGLRIGDGVVYGIEMGPLSHDRRLDAMKALVKDALACGAKLACGGKRMPIGGYFYMPTVLTEVPDAACVMQEEPFGPIAVINPWDDLEETLARANALPYALSAFLFTRDLAQAHELAARLEAGVVGVNHFSITQPDAPFGGLKESGQGSENGPEGLAAYLDTKLISLARP
ncbi:MAG TPA: NAD-dependent succinate-semialdehyde dehydrogenase [Candidatus Desulfobacillus sp.]|nr:NAD-dependent succinate-semialdehyde dehydrogenase [Candidatus Desulfobacillus sp.]